MNIDISKYSFPQTPGVYIFKDEDGKILYIGKSGNLRERIKSYFQVGNILEPHISSMVPKIADIEYIKCSSELEATFKEASLIRDLQPKYNIELKDNKSFPLIVIIKNDDFPFVTVKRESDIQKMKISKLKNEELLEKYRVRATKEKARMDNTTLPVIEYFGPLQNCSVTKNIVQLLQSIFKFRTCELSIFEGDKNRKYFKPCLLYYIKMCSAPCALKINKDEYEQNIEQFKKFLNGENSELIKELEEKMYLYAKNQEYEKAATLRDRISALKTLNTGKNMFYYNADTCEIAKLNPVEALKNLQEKFKLNNVPRIIDGIDISNISGQHATGAIVRFTNGYPDKSEYRRYKIKTVSDINDIAMMKEVITRRFCRLINEDRKLPDALLIDGGIGHLNEIEKVLEEFKVQILLIALAKYRKDHIYVKQINPSLNSTDTTSIFFSFPLDPKEPATQLLTFIRDEAHRFAKNYHKILRRKSIL